MRAIWSLWILQTVKDWCGNVINTYANKFDNLDDMEEFLDRYKLPKIMKEQIDNLNTMSISEIEFIV